MILYQYTLSNFCYNLLTLHLSEDAKMLERFATVNDWGWDYSMWENNRDSANCLNTVIIGTVQYFCKSKQTKNILTETVCGKSILSHPRHESVDSRTRHTRCAFQCTCTSIASSARLLRYRACCAYWDNSTSTNDCDAHTHFLTLGYKLATE